MKKTFLLASLIFIFSPLFARDVEITVTDLDLGIPLEGAVIRNWDGREYVCDSEGKAVFSVPDDRPVVIQGAYPGYENARLSLHPPEVNFTMELRLSGVMENRELVIEAARPGTSETKTGRSVAVSEREIAQTGEIGSIEDVMTTIKLLPGVGYTGMYNAQPSIRGGDPGDMSASLDGFYVTNPYHWAGGFSIFDPRMIQSAQLSHGVFSTRYGHTISGLLELAAKKPSSSETEFELGINTSAVNFSLSVPLFNRGGVMLMGRVTYYDPVIWLGKQLAKVVEEYRVVNAIRVAPYIRSGTLTGNYRFLDNLDLQLTGFWGMDGVGVAFNPEELGDAAAGMKADFDYTNYKGFITTGLSWNPRNDMLLKLTAGTGYEDAVIDGDMRYNILEKDFIETEDNSWYYNLIKNNFQNNFAEKYTVKTEATIEQSDLLFNAQGRLDYDWELGKGFLVAAGAQEMFSNFRSNGFQRAMYEKPLSGYEDNEQIEILRELGIDPDNPASAVIRTFLEDYLMVSNMSEYPPNAANKILTTSGYILSEFSTPNNKFGAELGLRLDHYYLLGNGLSLVSKPALNPRLNLDYNVFKGSNLIRSFDISVGTGLFTSMNTSILNTEQKYNLTELKPNRSWTSVLGSRFEFPEGLSFNIEAYYKYIYDRMYVPINLGLNEVTPQPQFNGEGNVWGIDVMIQKLQSRYWDGWLSYSFNWAKYRDPDSGNSDMGISGGVRGDDWYFPSYHRFHNLNLVFNIKPVPRINIYARFGFASGVQISRRIGDRPQSYPVYDREQGIFIEKYYWSSVRDENNRTTPSLPFDIKLSILGNNRTGKTRYEVYVAVENVLSLVYNAEGNTTFNQYTGEVSEGSMSAVYEIPIPVPSFGFKISY